MQFYRQPALFPVAPLPSERASSWQIVDIVNESLPAPKAGSFAGGRDAEILAMCCLRQISLFRIPLSFAIWQ